jgi:hypothetical protein
MVIKPEHLAALNLVLDANPDLKAAIVAKLDQAVTGLNELRSQLGPQAEVEQAPPGEEVADGLPRTVEEFKVTILRWFASHHGKHRLNEIRADLGVPQTSKPFKTAVVQLIGEKRLKGTGKRGVGAEYWVA